MLPSTWQHLQFPIFSFSSHDLDFLPWFIFPTNTLSVFTSPLLCNTPRVLTRDTAPCSRTDLWAECCICVFLSGAVSPVCSPAAARPLDWPTSVGTLLHVKNSSDGLIIYRTAAWDLWGLDGLNVVHLCICINTAAPQSSAKYEDIISQIAS